MGACVGVAARMKAKAQLAVEAVRYREVVVLVATEADAAAAGVWASYCRGEVEVIREEIDTVCFFANSIYAAHFGQGELPHHLHQLSLILHGEDLGWWKENSAVDLEVPGGICGGSMI